MRWSLSTACAPCRCAGDSPEAARVRELLDGGRGPRNLSDLMRLIEAEVEQRRSSQIGAAVEELRWTLPPQHPGMSTVTVPESVSCGDWRCLHDVLSRIVIQA